MDKTSTICFQTSAEMQSALETVAREEHQTVSCIIETILFQYLKSKRGFQGIVQNRRRCDRKQINLKALIGDPEWQQRDFTEGNITDISMGGIKFSVPKGTLVEMLTGDEANEFSVIFTLPNNIWKTKVKCRTRQVVESESIIQVGAAFISPDFQTCTKLQKYLI